MAEPTNDGTLDYYVSGSRDKNIDYEISEEHKQREFVKPKTVYKSLRMTAEEIKALFHSQDNK